MNIKKFKKLNFSVKNIFLLYYLFISLVCLSFFLYASLFLYKNFYKTITESEEIILLKKEVVSEDINIKKFEEIIHNIEIKIRKREPEHILKF